MSEPDPTPPEQDPQDPRLRELQQRLDKVRAGPVADEGSAARGEAMSQGWRLSMELVLAPLVGGGMGWLIDKWLGTRPWGLLIFLAFGAVAGFVNVVRTARQMNASANDQGGQG